MWLRSWSMPDGSQFVRLDGLKRYFDVSAPWLVRAIEGRPRQVVQAVDGIDIRIARGETFSLVGESGCGKSTVARLVVGLYPPTDGAIEFDGIDIEIKKGEPFSLVGESGCGKSTVARLVVGLYPPTDGAIEFD